MFHFELADLYGVTTKQDCAALISRLLLLKSHLAIRFNLSQRPNSSVTPAVSSSSVSEASTSMVGNCRRAVSWRIRSVNI